MGPTHAFDHCGRRQCKNGDEETDSHSLEGGEATVVVGSFLDEWDDEFFVNWNRDERVYDCKHLHGPRWDGEVWGELAV